MGRVHPGRSALLARMAAGTRAREERLNRTTTSLFQSPCLQTRSGLQSTWVCCRLLMWMQVWQENVWGLALESGKTFDTSITEDGVFTIAGLVLAKARVALKRKSEYGGSRLLLAFGMLSVGMTFLIQTCRFIRRKLKEGKFSSSAAPKIIFPPTCTCTSGKTWRSI
jgi:hypothetical protein